jgi:HTH-type transcriptional regulator, transcriptional repressor of NAD biosynthesis genes
LDALRSSGAGPIDVVVSAEGYGPQSAVWFEAAHLEVDRTANPISATMIRSDPVAYWDELTPAARAGLVCRVVILGAESTGTSTVAGLLAEHFRHHAGLWSRTICVAEHGRRYTEDLWAAQRASATAGGRPVPALTNVVWAPLDFDAVALAQTALEEAAAASGSPVLVCDTDAFATMVWERRYLGSDARPMQPWACSPILPRHDLYLLTSHEGVPWVDDGVREGDLAIRAAMTDWFADELTAAGHPWVLLEGTVDQRVAMAVRTIEPVLRRRLTFSSPLTGPGFEATG